MRHFIASIAMVLMLSSASYAQQDFPGSGPSNPIIAMSIEPAQLDCDIRASLKAWNRLSDSEVEYWTGHAAVPEEFSNHLWHQGWNRYWETRLQPGHEASADPGLGRLAAVARCLPPEPPPPPPPPPEPPAPLPSFDAARLWNTLEVLQFQADANTERIIKRIDDFENRAKGVMNDFIKSYLPLILGALGGVVGLTK